KYSKKNHLGKPIKGTENWRAVRDALMRIASLRDNEAALILANSGGLGNTYSDEEIQAQISRFLPTAVKQLQDLASKPNLTPEEHYTLYLYLNEIFSTIPEAIDLKAVLRELGIYKDYERYLYQN